jgi:RNA polymerase sigma-70 factor (ECF subfamily)
LLPKLRAYALVLTRSASDADDLVQDALLRAWRFRSGYTDGTNLKAWLFRILRNEFLNRLQAKKNTVEDVDGQFAARLVSKPEQDFQLQYGELMEGMGQLSPETREALLLTVGEGYTYEEAAALCDCPVGTIKSRVNRGRQFLIEHLSL